MTPHILDWPLISHNTFINQKSQNKLKRQHYNNQLLDPKINRKTRPASSSKPNHFSKNHPHLTDRPWRMSSSVWCNKIHKEVLWARLAITWKFSTALPPNMTLPSASLAMEMVRLKVSWKGWSTQRDRSLTIQCSTPSLVCSSTSHKAHMLSEIMMRSVRRSVYKMLQNKAKNNRLILSALQAGSI